EFLRAGFSAARGSGKPVAGNSRCSFGFGIGQVWAAGDGAAALVHGPGDGLAGNGHAKLVDELEAKRSIGDALSNRAIEGRRAEDGRDVERDAIAEDIEVRNLERLGAAGDGDEALVAARDGFRSGEGHGDS